MTRTTGDEEHDQARQEVAVPPVAAQAWLTGSMSIGVAVHRSGSLMSKMARKTR